MIMIIIIIIIVIVIFTTIDIIIGIIIHCDATGPDLALHSAC